MKTVKKVKKAKKLSIEDISRSYIDKLFNGSVPEDAIPDVDLARKAMELDSRPTDFDIRKIMSKSVDPVTGLPTNMRLPEGDFKEASSFFDFCSNFVSKDTRFPFARQMWIITQLFGEYCPTCTSPKWVKDIRNVPVDYTTKEMPEHMQFLRYGVCKKCGSKKSDHVRHNRMKIYSELDLEAGQRSGKSAISTTAAAYLTHKYLKFPKLSTVCEGIQASTPLTATFVGYRMTDAMNLLWQPITDIIDNSPWFCLEENTQITLEDGNTKAIKDVKKGDIVATLEGHSVVDNVFDNGVQECKTVSLENGKQITGTDEHKVRCLSPDGTSLMWKKISELAEDDYVVTE